MERSVTAETSLLSEFEWLDYLKTQGVSAVSPLRLTGNKLIHSVSDDYYFVTYEKVSGFHVNPQDKGIWNISLFEKWGVIMGKIHML